MFTPPKLMAGFKGLCISVNTWPPHNVMKCDERKGRLGKCLLEGGDREGGGRRFSLCSMRQLIGEFLVVIPNQLGLSLT